MIAIVHLLVVLVLCKLFKLDRTEAFAALLFGFLIDLDHAFAMFDFVKMQGITGALDYQAAMASDLEWKSMFHNPAAIVLIGPAAIGFRMAVPVLAWGLHIAMDWLQIEYLGVLSLPEMLLFIILLAALVYLEKRELDSTGRQHTHLQAVQSLIQQGGEELFRLFKPIRSFLGLRGTLS